MTKREEMIWALDRKAPIKGMKVPHFELVFFLTMESFGRVHPVHRAYAGWDKCWDSMSEKERNMHRKDMAELYFEPARKYDQNGFVVVGSPWNDFNETLIAIDLVREMDGMERFISVSIDPTFAIPNGDNMVDFSVRMIEDADGLKKETQHYLDMSIRKIELLHKQGLTDGITMCSDYCFNTNPFFSPSLFEEFIMPYLSRFIKECRDAGLYTIKHTDGNIMPILDLLVEANPHALHSLDPQGFVDLKEVKQKVGDKVALIGNVNCSLLQTGTDDEVIADCERALRDGMPGGGYIYATSNCIYTGMALERYELMLKVRDEKGIY